MKKTILSVAVVTTLGLTMGSVQAAPMDKSGEYLETAKDLIGALSYSDKQEYIEHYKTLETVQEKAAFFKMVIVAETSTKDAINFVLDRAEDGTGHTGLTREELESKMVGSGLLVDNGRGGLKIDDKSKAYKDLSARRDDAWKKHVQYDDSDEFYISPVVDGNDNRLADFLDNLLPPIHEDMPIVEPLTRDEIAAYIEANKESRDIDSHTEAQAALDFITTYTGNGKVVELSKDGQTITVDGTEYTIEQAKEFIKTEAVERSHNDDLLDPILDPIDPVEPIAGNPDAIKAYAKEAAIKWKNDLTDMQKRGVMEAAANRQGFEFETYENANGETIIKLTSEVNGVELGFTAEQFNDYMLGKHEERKGERQLRKTPELRDTKLREAVDTLWDSGQNLAVLGQESKAKLQAGAQGIKAGTEDLTEAGQTLKTDLTAGKAELEATAQTATEQMAAQFAAMQAQLDEQAKLIAELQAGENPSVPSTGISPEAESALRDASATLQAKMDVAVNKLQGAAKTLQEKGSKLAPQDPDFGINPPSQGVPTHELGSIGEGQAVAYVQNGLEELYNTGNEQAQQYADKALSDAKSYTDTQIAGINSRIDGIEEDLETVMATSQAVTAARPYLSSNQTNAIGVGLGNSGSQNAIAVGYAHRINENWTANANLSGTSGNEVDYSVGAGLSYAW
ncbi:YadA C-terminal domain-containing protein [Vibrio sp. DNB22_19_1]